MQGVATGLSAHTSPLHPVTCTPKRCRALVHAQTRGARSRLSISGGRESDWCLRKRLWTSPQRGDGVRSMLWERWSNTQKVSSFSVWFSQPLRHHQQLAIYHPVKLYNARTVSTAGGEVGKRREKHHTHYAGASQKRSGARGKNKVSPTMQWAIQHNKTYQPGSGGGVETNYKVHICAAWFAITVKASQCTGKPSGACAHGVCHVHLPRSSTEVGYSPQDNPLNTARSR